MFTMTVSTGEAHALEGGVPERGRIPVDSYEHRLMLARAHAGNLSIRAAAERCGLNHANWANWEQGMRSRTMIEDVQAISEGLGVDRNWLLFGGALARPEPARRTRRGDRHGRSQITRKSIGDGAEHKHRPFGRRTGTAPTGRRADNDRPRVLRVPTV